MRASDTSGRLAGITFAKQFPNPAEPLRGLFVADQVSATADAVDWRVISAVPYIPRALAGPLRKLYIKGEGDFAGIRVDRPRYPVLPRRMLYSTVAPAIAASAAGAFERAVSSGAAFVHVHDLYPSGAAVRRLAAKHRLPVVVTIHGSDLYTNLAKPRWAAEVRAVIAAADAVIGVSSALAADAVELAGCDPAKLCVVPNTYDDRRFTYTERDAAADRPVQFISVGRLVPVKGHDLLIDAFADAVAGGLDAELTIVGGGPERTALERLAAMRAVAARVRFTGALGGDELASAVSAADAFVLPSRREGFGVVLIEALATGMPAIATRSGGPEDIMGDGDGLLIAVEDRDGLAAAMTAVAGSLHAWDGRAIAARVRKRYGSQSVGERLVSVYRSVLEGTDVCEGLRYGV